MTEGWNKSPLWMRAITIAAALLLVVVLVDEIF
jgi:hypothetical protein